MKGEIISKDPIPTEREQLSTLDLPCRCLAIYIIKNRMCAVLELSRVMMS